MPTYEYRCGECGHSFNMMHGITKEFSFSCSLCGNAMERVISGGGYVKFVGSGFYNNDYGKIEKAFVEDAKEKK